MLNVSEFQEREHVGLRAAELLKLCRFSLEAWMFGHCDIQRRAISCL
jgi:hypothetical protein